MLKLKHLNFYYSKLSSTLLTADTDCTVDTMPLALPAGYRYRMKLQDADPFGSSLPTVIEFVDVIYVGATLTLDRAVEQAGDYPARDWVVDPGITDVWLVSVDTAESRDKLNGVELVRYAEPPATVTTGAMERAVGGIAMLSLAADTAVTWDLTEGEKQQLYITPSTYTVTDWGVDHWMTDIPDFGNGDTEYMVIAERVNGVVYGWWGGSRA